MFWWEIGIYERQWWGGRITRCAASCKSHSRVSLTIARGKKSFKCYSWFHGCELNQQASTCEARGWTGEVAGQNYWQSFCLEPAVRGGQALHVLVICSPSCCVCGSNRGATRTVCWSVSGVASWNRFCFGYHQRANVWDCSIGADEKYFWWLISAFNKWKDK